MARTIQRYGWKHSPPDHRDIKADVAGLTVLAEVDPRPLMPRVFDQQSLGACTSNAVAACIEYDRTVDNPSHPNLERPSRLFIYYGERMLEGSLNNGDCGAIGRDGFKFAQNYGWVKEGEWPYDINEYAVKPPAQAWTDALTRRLTKTYASVPQDKQAIQLVLSSQQTVAFGFTVYESFESNKVASNGIVPMPGPFESQVGGHEVLAIGYLAAYPNHVLCRNSWGTTWGLAGYFLFPWNYLLNSDLASDLRTIVRPLVAT